MAYEEYMSVKKRNIGHHLGSQNLSETQKQELTGFLEAYRRRNPGKLLSTATMESYVRSIGFLGQFLHARGKEFRDITEADLKAYFESLEGKSRSVGDWARTAVKVFYRWLLNGSVAKNGAFPEIVKWIKVGYIVPTKVQKDDCLTANELDKMQRTQVVKDMEGALQQFTRELRKV